MKPLSLTCRLRLVGDGEYWECCCVCRQKLNCAICFKIWLYTAISIYTRHRESSRFKLKKDFCSLVFLGKECRKAKILGWACFSRPEDLTLQRQSWGFCRKRESSGNKREVCLTGTLGKGRRLPRYKWDLKFKFYMSLKWVACFVPLCVRRTHCASWGSLWNRPIPKWWLAHSHSARGCCVCLPLHLANGGHYSYCYHVFVTNWLTISTYLIVFL
jgi:hypothetical protein